MLTGHAWRAVSSRARRALGTVLAVVLLTLSGARADQLADFNAAVENASAHNRVAIGYLRTGNTELASLEIDRARAAWRGLVGGFGGNRPAAFTDATRYTTVLTDVSMRFVTASMMLTMGRPDVATRSLTAIRTELADLRQSAGIEVLADCILKANTAMDALLKYDQPSLDLANQGTRDGLTEKATRYGAVLDHCDRLAGDDIRARPEFRRLVDGAKSSLALVPQAIAEKDSARIHRILIELRSFDNLLAFRFG